MSHEVVRNRFERGMPIRLSERGVSFHIRTPKGSLSKHWEGNASQCDALPAEFFERAD
jgi:hypothetical protein